MKYVISDIHGRLDKYKSILPTSIETDVNGKRFHMVHGFPVPFVAQGFIPL